MKKVRSRLDILYKRQGRMVPQVAMLMALLLILFLGSSKLATIGWANGPTTVSIDPYPQGVILGDTATTDVLIEDVTNLYGFEFQITFDPTLVEGVQVQPGSFLSPDWEIDNTIDKASGTIDYALCQQGSSSKSGDGVLATITWLGKAVGTSPITLTHVLLGAAGGISITTGTQDGEITVVAGSIGDYVWIDDDGGGDQGTGESGINGVVVELYEDENGNGTIDTEDDLLQTTTTMTNTLGTSAGWYQFMNLAAGDYIVKLADSNFQSGGTLYEYLLTTQNASGVDDALNSDFHETDHTASVTLAAGEQDFTIDGGVEYAGAPVVITLSSFTARSSVGMEAPSVWPWLVGVAALAVGGVLWVKRRANGLGRTDY